MRTLAELLRWRARRHPDLVALREPGNEITWAELDAGTTAICAGGSRDTSRASLRLEIITSVPVSDNPKSALVIP